MIAASTILLLAALDPTAEPRSAGPGPALLSPPAPPPTPAPRVTPRPRAPGRRGRPPMPTPCGGCGRPIPR